MKKLLQSSYSFKRAAITTLLLLLAAPGCDDTGEPTGATTGSGGAGGATSTGGAGGSSSTTSTGGSTTSTGGSTTSTGTGGTGGAPVTCLPASATDGLFTLVAADLCAIAVFTADDTIAYQQPTWGAHGGPLLVSGGPADGEVTLSRWTPPSGDGGKLTIVKTTVAAKIPKGAFAGAEALDLGFRPGTAVSYSGAFPDTAGELVIIDGASTSERYAVNGLFSMVVVPPSGANMGARLLHSGFSKLGDSAMGKNALYAADDCSGSFTPMGACKAPLEITAWGDNSGPAFADSSGNVVVVMANASGDQEGRGFAASAIANGAAATEGDALFTMGGFGQSLAAIAPAAGAPGIVAFQPSDAKSFEALDVKDIRYTADGGKVSAVGAPGDLVKLPMKNTPVAMLTDPEDHLWIGVPTASGTTFVVLARKP